MEPDDPRRCVMCDNTHLQGCHTATNPRTCEKAVFHLKSFVAIILLLIDGDNPSSPSFLGFVVDN